MCINAQIWVLLLVVEWFTGNANWVKLSSHLAQMFILNILSIHLRNTFWREKWFSKFQWILYSDFFETTLPIYVYLLILTSVNDFVCHKSKLDLHTVCVNQFFFMYCAVKDNCQNNYPRMKIDVKITVTLIIILSTTIRYVLKSNLNHFWHYLYEVLAVCHHNCATRKWCRTVEGNIFMKHRMVVLCIIDTY